MLQLFLINILTTTLEITLYFTNILCIFTDVQHIIISHSGKDLLRLFDCQCIRESGVRIPSRYTSFLVRK